MYNLAVISLISKYMKKSFVYFLALVIFVPVVSFGAVFRAGEQTSVNSNEKIIGDLYISGGSVTSSGSVSGDLIAGSGNILINGPVGGDLIAGGGTVTILSDVADDVRIGGGDINIQGKVGGDVLVGGGQVNIGGKGIEGDLVVGGGNVRIDAPVRGSLKVGGGNVYINSEIAGDIKIIADKVTLGKSANIKGRFSYKAGEELTKEDGAVVSGQVDFTPSRDKEVSVKFLAGIASIWVLGSFLTLFLSSLFIGFMFKKYSHEVLNKAKDKPLHEIGRGLLVFILLPVLSVLMFVTLVGYPFGIMGVIAFVSLLLFGWIISPIIVGSVVYNYFSKGEYVINVKTILVGVITYKLIGIIPVLGFIFQALLMLLTIGIIVSIKRKIVSEWR